MAPFRWGDLRNQVYPPRASRGNGPSVSGRPGSRVSFGNAGFPQLAGCTRPNHPQRPSGSMSLQGSLVSMTCFGPRNPPQDDPGFGVRLDEEMPWAMTGPILRRWPVPHVPNPAYFPYSSPFQSVLFEVPFGFPVVISGWGDWSRFRQRRYCRWGAPGKCFYVDS